MKMHSTMGKNDADHRKDFVLQEMNNGFLFVVVFLSPTLLLSLL